MKKWLLITALVAAACSAASAQQGSNWYPFHATGDPAAGEIGMQEWTEKPAGRAGRITRDGDKLTYDGNPIKLWGLNLCFENCLPPKDVADKRAAFYAKYGINSVRLHKFTESSYQTGDSVVDFNPAAIDRMDYQIAKLKDAGIYVDLSVHFGAMVLGPGDKKYVPYIEELGKFPTRQPSRITLAHSTIFYSPELQEVHIRQMLNLLSHKNRYTELTYAREPAVAFLEIINEQSILFYSSTEPLKRYPTIRKMTAGRFSDWLKKKYGTSAGLTRAWGAKALDSFKGEGFPAGESLEQGTILPIGNPWYWDPANLNGSQSFRRRRLLDTLEFLYSLQCEFYDRYTRAVRDAGYPGEIIGSNWQAGRAFSHLANLYSDWRVGTIDRHNYFGGEKRGGGFDNASMLSRPGSGILSSGLQQAADRPFMLSEWIHVHPNEWGAEGPAIVAAYGLGLQGWDASYLFQNGDRGTFSDLIGRDQWDAVAPQILGLFPAIARQIQRGDVKESQVLAVRNVHVPSLFQGKLSFDDTVKQGHDAKQLDSSKVPAESLAVARDVIAFTGKYVETPVFHLEPYRKDGALVSSTGQLRWKPGSDATSGFFTIDTDATKAVVGFASGQELRLGNVTLRPKSRFCALYVTAHSKTQTVANAEKLLIVAIARARNTGMTFNADENRVTAKGKSPILLEPVAAEITIENCQGAHVTLLDHDGRRTTRTLPVQNGHFTLDGSHDQTPYYLLERIR
jgi:glycosyl hydrolase family 42 (putative beta-galactosidase)